MNWDFNLPVKLVFGVGRHKELPAFIDEIGGKVGVLVCSHSFAKNGLADEFVSLSNGRIKAVFFRHKTKPYN